MATSSQHRPWAWQNRDCWRVLDTRWDIQRCLRLWRDWREDAQRPRLLHLVALCGQAPTSHDFLCAEQTQPDCAGLALELSQAAWGLLPGFHRISLQEGQFLLTLCVGQPQALLREQQFAADAVILDLTPQPDPFVVWDRWLVKSLARCCQRGAPVTVLGDVTPYRQDLVQNGFVDRGEAWQFNPPWQTRQSRQTWRSEPIEVGRCVVIGAGLAGAAVAASLARRGWQVTVLDAAQAPASGASGLPAGLLVSHVSADDSPRSRLSRAGVRMMLAQAQDHLLVDQDWSPCGVLECRLDGRSDLPQSWPVASGRDWATSSATPGLNHEVHLMHKPAGWIKPAQMVRVWLATAGVTFVGQAQVGDLIKEGAIWHVLNTQGQSLARADLVVLANAQAAWTLLEAVCTSQPGLSAQITPLPAQLGMRGVVSWATQSSAETHQLPAVPVNGQGSVIAHVPTPSGLRWYVGATYEDSRLEAPNLDDHHASNLSKLARLLPDVAQQLAPRFDNHDVQSWTGTRCVSTDRMPVVGPLQSGPQPSLWISAAMGSRGLSFAFLCAELLAARLHAEPLPIEASLAASLNATRQTT